MILEITAAVFMVAGAFFALASAIGLVRFSDTFLRAHALGMGATVGILFGMLGVILALTHLGAGAKGLLTVGFIFLTAPVGSHMLGRAAYMFLRLPSSLRLDELAEHRVEMDDDDHPIDLTKD